MGGPHLVWSGLRGFGDVFQRIVHGSREALRLRRTLRSKLNGRGRGQQWYARPEALYFAGKPRSFNTIGGVTGTRRAFESRTEVQGRRESQAMLQVVLGEPYGMQ